MRLFVVFFFYIFHELVRVCEINRIHPWCPAGAEESQSEGPPFQWESRLAEFPTERCTEGWDFSGTTEHQSHIPILKSNRTVRYSIISVGYVTEVDVYSQ